MRLRAPLYAKIGGWLLANLLLVALLLGVFVEVQYHLGLDSLLAGRAGDRMAAVAGVIATELRTAGWENRDAILAPFSESYQVRFSLYTDDGTRLAGDGAELPPPVRARLGERPPRLDPRPHRGPRPREEDPVPPPGSRPPPGPAEPPPPPVGRPSMVRTADPAQYWVLVRLPLRAPQEGSGGGPGSHPPSQVTLVARSDSVGGGGLFFEWTPWLLAAAAVLTVSVLCWLPLVRGVTRALWRLTEATGRIAEGRFDVRVAEESRGDELGALAGSINRMAARLDGFVTGQKRFLGDIAHELCAPLARLQMAVGILEQRATPGTRASVDDLREEVEQMSALVGELLSFTRASLAEGGTRGADLATVELRPLVEQAIRRESPADAVKVEIPVGLSAQADADLLLRAVSNLLRNSLRHAAGTGPVTVEAGLAEGGVLLCVRDRGPGVPEEAIGQVFDPFYRLDPSRDRATGGVGLGLAIVKTCVDACGGTVAGRNVQPTGFEVTIVLAAGLPDHDK